MRVGFVTAGARCNLALVPCNAKAQFTRCHYTRRGIHAVRLH